MKVARKNRRYGDTLHAWHGAWNRPVYMDEAGLHPFTLARMTDHNVRGPDRVVTHDSLESSDSYSHAPGRLRAVEPDLGEVSARV